MMIKSEKGVSAVEFALIAPLLFVLTFGIIEFSILLFDKAVVTNASREAARAAIVYNTKTSPVTYQPIAESEVKKVVQTYTDKYLINLGGTSVPITTVNYIPGATAESHGDVRVTVSYEYDFLVFPDLSKLLGGSFTGKMTVVGTTLMRME
jgi:Flp pilus assembly protein TadG